MHLCVMLSDDETARFAKILDGLIGASRTILKPLRAAEMYAECDEVKRELRVLLKLRDRIQKWQEAKEATHG